jgi:hypothetical protein
MITKLIVTILVCLQSIVLFSQNTQLLEESSNDLDSSQFVSHSIAQKYYSFFEESDLFIWTDVANNCEDRANAVSILLDAWDVPNYKVWIFNGSFLKKEKSKLCGDCPDNICWGFHVATVIPYKENGTFKHCVVDPATLDKKSSVNEWGENLTCSGTTYYMFTNGKKYIFSKSGTQFGKDTFWNRNSKNLKWTFEGLAGINGKNFWHAMGKPFKKKKIKKLKADFARLKENNPIK